MPLNPGLLGTPTGHGEVLVVPDPQDWVPHIRHNTAALRAAVVRVGDNTLAAWRTTTRMALTGRDDAPIVVLGHQPEFIHPGVWAKHVVADRVARAVGGIAINLIVDNDVLKSSTFSLPHRNDKAWSLRPIRFTSAGAATPYEFLPALQSAEIDRMETDLHETIDHDFSSSLLPFYLEGLRSDANPRDWVQQTVAGRRAVDHAFGISLLEHRVSQLSFVPLLLETLREPLRFAHAYNDSLDEYRVANFIRATRRPMPDLRVADNDCELPWWVVRPGLPRQRLFLQTRGNRVSLLTEQSHLLDLSVHDLGSASEFAKAISGHSTWSVRPRAITLTLWARLFLADYFIHGIGGAKYDAVCDGIISRYFGLTPPHFAAVSATLQWDPLKENHESPSPSAAEHALRDFRYNPHRYLSGSAEVAEQLVQRQKAIDESNDLARNSPNDRIARRRAFLQIHAANQALLDMHPDWLRDFESQIAEATLSARQRAIALGREYFFAAYPQTELARLATALPDFANLRL